MQTNDQKPENKKSFMSPYLASLSDAQLKKKTSTMNLPTQLADELAIRLHSTETAEVSKKGKLQKGGRKNQKPASLPKRPMPRSEIDPKKNIKRPDVTNVSQKNNTSIKNVKLRPPEKSLSSVELRKVQNLWKVSRLQNRPSSSKAKLGQEHSVQFLDKELLIKEDEQEPPIEPIPKVENVEVSQEESQTGTKLKSILKSDKYSKLKLPFPFITRRGAMPIFMRGKNAGDGYDAEKTEDQVLKKVRFFDKVLIHPVPYENRGSTEWQQNLAHSRENFLQTLLSSAPQLGNYLTGNLFYSNASWGGASAMDTLGLLTPPRARRPKPS